MTSPFEPTEAIGALVRSPKGELLGTAFAFRQYGHFLTAAHCVKDLDPKELLIASGYRRIVRGVREVIKHKNADIALLVAEPIKDDETHPFWDLVGNLSLGEDFVAYGYPEDAIGPNEGRPTPRIFKGYFHRFMRHKSHLGYEYLAGELSTPCPSGLSGGPLFRPGALTMLTGLVTEDIEATTSLHETESFAQDGSKVVDHYRRVVTFGVGLMLTDVKDWLDQHVKFDLDMVSKR
jgi:hypothetical protein